ncbi:ATP-binding protein [Spirochaeta isovalerica]|uniref:Anti-sigma regulatory factor (Ser/Thr protein kinase) n=1 Tax=Spirochaeta isovalerica TaxID=150 RepID=A0A841RAN3_9SPIO|nr:ATP-binding protein [Spirochaeta isovalerica]MBB6482444.1 anti-sigma regulatory factor (Ser/Thr protein kinase) [Spirochaeta isovalerica]
MEFHFDVCGEDYSMAGSASGAIKKKLNQLGLPALIVRKTAIVMYEAEINMVIHAGGGVVDVTITPEVITIILKDEGPGIPDIDKAMEAGYSTASDKARELGFGAGMGLPNIQKNSDGLTIESEVGKGTTVTIVVKLK